MVRENNNLCYRIEELENIPICNLMLDITDCLLEIEYGNKYDALPSPGLNPLEGSTMCSWGKLGLGRCSRLPTL